ncbi:hypothetical protein F0562_026435 [Nyssa sinensis]|uniref:Uncharacterized protein n=1 Tax=Nyssa sinensis TaxID=561372 RepID=A0A5J5B975_9ASTE|nr:hypothetical protein F0562_026435 [Nyssa sinensis]
MPESSTKMGSPHFTYPCKEGHLEITKKLIQSNRGLCFLKDKNGRSPLHAAAMKGRVEVTKVLLEDCPESVKDVTATDETCLHIAVVYNKFEVIQYLVKWLGERPDYADLVNQKDLGGNTVLHLAVSRKQLQALKELLTCNPNISKLVTVNAMNHGGFTALDILDVLPYGGKIDMEIDKLLREAGGLRGRDIVSHDNDRRGCYHRQPSHLNSIKYIMRPRKENAHYVLLVTATLLATITYHAAFSSPGIVKEGL